MHLAKLPKPLGRTKSRKLQSHYSGLNQSQQLQRLKENVSKTAKSTFFLEEDNLVNSGDSEGLEVLCKRLCIA